MRAFPLPSRTWWLLLLAGVVVGCTPPRKKVETDIVRRVVFLDNGGSFSGHNDLQLKSAMDQQASPPLTFTFPFMYFLQPSKLSLDTLRADSRRLETWYAHHGWFDMRMVGWQVRRVRQRKPERAGVVDLVGTVEPGPRSTLRNVEWTGLARGDAASTVVRAAAAEAGLAPGEPFDLDVVREARATAIAYLQDHLHAYADVTIDVQAYPEQEVVDVSLHVEEGIVTRFGEVTIEGPRRVSIEDVRELLTISEGDNFKVSRLQESQQALFDSQLFSLVDVEPDLSDPTRQDVPIRVRVTEAKFRRFRVGFGAQYDLFNVIPRLELEFKDVNVARSKLQLDARGEVGAIIGVVREDDSSPVETFITTAAEIDFSYPWLLKRALAIQTSASYERDAEFGNLPYQQLGGQFKLRYVFPKVQGLSLSGGPEFVYREYLESSEAIVQAARARFGGDFTGTVYRLLTFDVSLRYDARDVPHPLETRNGWYGELDLRQSIPIPTFDDPQGLDSSFRYFKIDGELRRWIPFGLRRGSRKPFVLAGKLHGTAVIPETRDTALPHPDLAFLGGPSSLRGYRSEGVGPYDAIAQYPDGRPTPQHANGSETRVDYSYVPRGGSLSLEMLAELRYTTAYGISLAIFGDGGLLYQRPLVEGGPGFLAWGASGGIGARYNSPIGPIRVDLALRPTHPWDRGTPYDPSSPSVSAAHTRYFGFNPTDILPRGYDVASGSLAARHALADGGEPLPVAFNFLLAIGEAF